MLSFSKLENLLTRNGFIPKSYFTLDDMIIYIEIVSLKTANVFMIYIPSKYDIQVPKDNEKNIYKLETVDLDNLKPSPKKELYPEINLNTVKLEDSYNKKILMKDDESGDILDITSQLERLKLCVMNMRYKLCIVYGNILAAVARSDNSIVCYTIKNINFSVKTKRIYILTDLELLYENLNCLELDINKIEDGLYKIIEENNTSFTKSISRLITEYSSANVKINDVMQRRNSCVGYILKFKELLAKLIDNENKLINNIVQLKDNANLVKYKTLDTDIETIQQQNKLEEQLNRISVVKREVINNLIEVKDKYNNMTLNIDKMMFENVSMMDKILKNFDEILI